MKKMRYFMFGAVYTDSKGRTTNSNQGCGREYFPTRAELQEIISELYDDNISAVVILSICELKKKDYEKFFEIKG